MVPPLALSAPDTVGTPLTEHPLHTAFPRAQPARSTRRGREGQVLGFIPAYHKMGNSNKKLEIPLHPAPLAQKHEAR